MSEVIAKHLKSLRKKRRRNEADKTEAAINLNEEKELLRDLRHLILVCEMGLEVYKLDNESPSLIFRNGCYKHFSASCSGLLLPVT